MKRIYTILAVFLLAICMGKMQVEACPMCRVALEEDSSQLTASMPSHQLPQAYMTSILFMLTVPFMIFGTIGGLMYYLNKEEQKLAEELTAKAISNANPQY